MSQSLSQIYLHLVFSTKNREPFLIDKAFRDISFVYLVGICRNLQCPSLIVGGVADHVHILCRFGKEITVAVLIRELKRESSKWVKAEAPHLSGFYWQNGYGAFSISSGHIEASQTIHRGARETPPDRIVSR